MLSMLLSRKLDERKARLINEGWQEGRVTERAEWDAWLERMMAAQAKGEPFAEPPPSRRADEANGKA